MRYPLYIITTVVLSILISSCRKDFSTTKNYGELSFSKDTVFLDTIFTNISSATYSVKVYNRKDKAITIPKIELENGTSSNYRLNVDGIAGKSFEDIDILANDSLFIFIESTINAKKVSNPLYTDKIIFNNGNSKQDIDLVTLVQDATFLYPDRNAVTLEIDSLILNGKKVTKGRFLKDDELTFTKNKPYVIYGYVAVPKNKTLTINAGAKIHFHKNSGLIIDKKASLHIKGTAKEKVIIEGDRLEHSFSKIPGQWGTIWLRKGSYNNQVNHTIVKNGTIGFLADSIGSKTKPTLTIKNSEIYNSASFGILGRETAITGSNVVIGNSGQSSFAGILGGSYDFTHCTFANYWKSSLRKTPAVLINNYFNFTNNKGQNTKLISNLKKANFTNCIISGNSNIELAISKSEGNEFNYNIKNCLIKFNDINNSYTNNNELNFKDTNHYQNNILNGNPHFKDTSLSKFFIGEESDAINKADSNTSLMYPLDILEKDRTQNPDIGAYQHTKFK